MRGLEGCCLRPWGRWKAVGDQLLMIGHFAKCLVFKTAVASASQISGVTRGIGTELTFDHLQDETEAAMHLGQ